MGWLVALQPELPPQLQARAYSLGLQLVGDAEIATLNQDWRAKAGPTDVLAFAAQDDDSDGLPPFPMPPGTDLESAGDGGEALELGDIVISLETAARQALDHGQQGRVQVHAMDLVVRMAMARLMVSAQANFMQQLAGVKATELKG